MPGPLRTRPLDGAFPLWAAMLKAALQERWTASLRERARLAPGSIVPVLDALLAEQDSSHNKIRSQIAPKIGHGAGELRPRNRK